MTIRLFFFFICAALLAVQLTEIYCFFLFLKGF